MRWLQGCAFRLSMAGVAIASGCAAKVEHQYPFSEGWRASEVVRLGHEIVPPEREADDCRLDMTWVSKPNVQFAEVMFRSHRYLKNRIVPLPEGSVVRVGGRLYVNVLDCGQRAGRGQSAG